MAGTSVTVLRLRQLPRWNDSIGQLRELHVARRDTLAQKVDGYSDRYKGERAAMIVDVVLSRQRQYSSRILPKIALFRQTEAASSLTALAELGPGDLGWVRREDETARGVAAGLARYCEEREMSEDDGVLHWVLRQEPIRSVWRLDPYVSQTKGIGIALFVYLRMRSGADAIKPDVRVRKAMNKLGFAVPGGDAALVLMAEAAAEELGLGRLELDQLLW